jgi:hypothetical protein
MKTSNFFWNLTSTEFVNFLDLLANISEQQGCKNPFEDFRTLFEDTQEISKQSKVIDMSVEFIENGKRILQNHIDEIVAKDLPVSDFIVDNYNSNTKKLSNIVEERMILFSEYKKIIEREKVINKKSEEVYKYWDILMNDCSISKSVLDQIEQLLTEFKEIVVQKKKIIKKRMEIISKERLLIEESKNLFNIK